LQSFHKWHKEHTPNFGWVPGAGECRSYWLPQLYDEHKDQLQAMFAGRHVVIGMDESPDVLSRKVMQTMFYHRGTSKVVTTEFLPRVDNVAVSDSFTNALRIYNKANREVLAFVTDGVAYNVLAQKNLVCVVKFYNIFFHSFRIVLRNYSASYSRCFSVCLRRRHSPAPRLALLLPRLISACLQTPLNPKVLMIVCWCHKIDNVVDVLIVSPVGTIVVKFLRNVTKLFSKSGARKHRWIEHLVELRCDTPALPLKYCEARWGSFLACCECMLRWYLPLQSFVKAELAIDKESAPVIALHAFFQVHAVLLPCLTEFVGSVFACSYRRICCFRLHRGNSLQFYAVAIGFPSLVPGRFGFDPYFCFFFRVARRTSCASA
jgi:hypothetical protein